MSDSFVQVSPDSTGKLIDNSQLTTTSGTVQRQRVVVGDNTTSGNYLSINSSGAISVSPASATPATATALTPFVVNISASGDTTIVAATASMKTKLYRLMIVFGGATNFTIKDGASTALTGAMPMLQGGGITLDYSGDPWYTGSTNTAFIFNSSVAVQISGTAYYVLS